MGAIGGRLLAAGCLRVARCSASSGGWQAPFRWQILLAAGCRRVARLPPGSARRCDFWGRQRPDGNSCCSASSRFCAAPRSGKLLNRAFSSTAVGGHPQVATRLCLCLGMGLVQEASSGFCQPKKAWRGQWCVAEIIARVLLGIDAPRGVAPPCRTLRVWLRRCALRETPLPSHYPALFLRHTTSWL